MRSVLAVVAAVLALPLPAVSAVAAPAMAAEEQAAIDRLAREIVGTETASMAKARRIIDWLNANFVWTDTDYGRRSLVEIIERRGGNCAEQARVARALMTVAGIRTRQIAEVNIQPESPQRQKDAEEVVAQYGASASVFGLAHNDHRWLEVFDETTESWQPADPTLGLVGVEQWMRARVGFGARPVHHILPSRDMLVPVAIFALPEDGSFETATDRTGFYLVEQFGGLYGEALTTQPEWAQWRERVQALSPVISQAFQGTVNLHTRAGDLKAAGDLYRALQAKLEGAGA